MFSQQTSLFITDNLFVSATHSQLRVKIDPTNIMGKRWHAVVLRTWAGKKVMHKEKMLYET